MLVERKKTLMMNKITLKNFFAVLLACLLIVAMMLLQLPNTQTVFKFAYIIELIVVVAAVIFILHKMVAISNELAQKTALLDNISKELASLKDKEKQAKQDDINTSDK